MRSLKLAAIVALLAGGMAFGQSQVVYTLELGGDNHADLWENAEEPTFTSGTTTGVLNVNAGDDVTWAVRVSVGGQQLDGPSYVVGLHNGGAANLVFDLELYGPDEQLVDFGAAPMECTPVGDRIECEPIGPGFWSSINDGDDMGARGLFQQDVWANAALARAIHKQGDVPPATMATLKDPVTGTTAGPNFDYGWYPSSNGRGGIPMTGGEPVMLDNSLLNGKLVGFGAGYKSFDATSYLGGVGKYIVSDQWYEFGFGAFVDDLDPGASDPLSPPQGVIERPLFEGQISTIGLGGTYTLKVVPSAEGTNVLHGMVEHYMETPSYGGLGSFAVKADEVYGLPAAGVQFYVEPPPQEAQVVGRYVFYNGSSFGDAVDSSKAPLLPAGGTSTFANWTGYANGINGLIYEIQDSNADPVQSDFLFETIGKNGAGAPVVKTPASFAVTDLGGGLKQVKITFADNDIRDTWLQVTISGFGLAASDVHWWGNAPGDSGNGTCPNILVDASDEIGARNNPRNIFNPAPIEFPWDYNKDKLVNATDELVARNNPTNIFNCMKCITK